MRHFVNKFSILFLVFTILEQLIAATSTYAMIALSSEILKGEGMIWFGVFVLSLVLVFVPRIFSQKYMVKAEYATFQRYLSLYESNLYNQPSLKTSHAFGGERQSYFQNQTWQTIEKTYEFFGDLMATVLNVVFNVLVIGWSLSPWFFAAYLCAAAVIAAGILTARGKIVRKSAGAQEAQSAVQNRLFDGWDTLLIGNRYNWSRWKEVFGRTVDKAEKTETQYRFSNNILSLLIMVGSIFPMILVVLWTLADSAGNVGRMTSVIVTLPRQVSNIQYLSVIVEYVTELVGIREKVRNIDHAASAVEKENQYHGTIRWENLRFSSGDVELRFENVENFLEFLKDCAEEERYGRILITGTNGSGKTTVLMRIKEYFGDRAYLFPNHTRLFFEDSNERAYSTGQRLRANVEEVLDRMKDPSVRLFLFDEWNANLDEENQKEISEYIDRLAKKGLVLEVRNKEV